MDHILVTVGIFGRKEEYRDPNIRLFMIHNKASLYLFFF